MPKLANFWKRLLVPAVAATLLLTSQMPSQASTATTAFNVTLTVTASCTVSASALAFGSTGIIVGNLDSTSAITITCTDGTPYDAGLDAGAGSGATLAARVMTAAGQR